MFPLTHVGGIGWLIASFMAGFAHIAVAIFEPKSVIPLLARHGVTQAGAGTVFHQAYLTAQREQPGTRLFPRVRAFPGGGAPKPPQLHYDVKQELGGVGIVSGYGLTECPIIAMNTVRNSDEQLANTEGRVNPPEAEIRVMRPDGAPAAPGEEGELCFRGPQLFRGYLDASLDAAAFDADGFFRTGDLGRLDADGCVVITGRTKDVIIRKGENISAKEVEDLLYTHPKVADVAVIGLPDPGARRALLRGGRVQGRCARVRGDGRVPGRRGPHAAEDPRAARDRRGGAAQRRGQDPEAATSRAASSVIRGDGSPRIPSSASRTIAGTSFGVGFAREKNRRTVIGPTIRSAARLRSVSAGISPRATARSSARISGWRRERTTGANTSISSGLCGSSPARLGTTAPSGVETNTSR